MSKYAFELKPFPIAPGVPNLSEHMFDLIGETVAPRERAWAIQDLVPLGEVILTAGDGGVGKSTLALQMAAHLSLGRPLFGKAVRRMPGFVVSLEDDVLELRRRFWQIAKALGVAPKDLDLIGGIARGDFDATLFGPDPQGGLAGTRTFQFIEGAIEYFVRMVESRAPVYPEHDQGGSAVVFIDNASAAFAGNENSRPEVRAFISRLYALARRHDLTIVLLSHVSKAGQASGLGYSGSTDWHNAVRCRLYLSKPRTEPNEPPPDKTEREFSVQKSNFGPDGMIWKTRLVDGYFHWSPDRFAPNGEPNDIEARLLDTVRKYATTGRSLSPSRNALNYAPRVALRETGGRKSEFRAFEAAFESLLELGRIRIDRSGPPSRQTVSVQLGDA